LSVPCQYITGFSLQCQSLCVSPIYVTKIESLVFCALAKNGPPAGLLAKDGNLAALTAAALEAARQASAPGHETYPLDADLSPSVSSTGYITTFEQARFKIITRRVLPRPIICFDFQRPDNSRSSPDSQS
jgi:hypothetical protein